jgi:hypothetical protein
LAVYLRDGLRDSASAGPLIDQVATSLALARVTSPVRDTSESSLSVSTVDAGAVKKVGGSVSKTDPKSGVQGCGRHPRSARSLEVPSCA